MLFNSLNYLLFFPLVFCAYWCSPKAVRPLLLLVASYFFYMSWLPAYGALLFLLSLVNYLAGLAIEKFQNRSKQLFVLGVVINLAVLCFFKYTGFILANLATIFSRPDLASSLTIPFTDFTLANIILPLGISFFTFEFIHYLTDVYKGSSPIKNPIEFGLFAAFFPSQIAGPIKRYQDFRAQLAKEQVFSGTKFSQGLTLLLQGLFKKVALADNLSPAVATAFAQVQTIGTLDAWLAVIGFALQIYFDFSGYTDMGRGSAMMLGFSLPDNFNLPYIASSASDFWKRWHISLSTWLRDYLYIPLGGGRVNRWRKHMNLMVTMLLGGLWHGAAWHFVFWGGFHGAALVINHEYDRFASGKLLLERFHKSRLGTFASALLTFACVLFGWILFRADTLDQCRQMLTHMFSFAPSAPVVEIIAGSTLAWGLLLYTLYLITFRFSQTLKLGPLTAMASFARRPALLAACWTFAFVCSIGLSPSHAEPFIYFQF